MVKWDIEVKFAVTAKRYVTEFGMSVAEVLMRQAGLLQKALVEDSPPKDRKKSEQRINEQVFSRFAAAGDAEQKHFGRFASSKVQLESKGVHWYAWTKTKLFGVAAANDMRKASAADLFRLFPKLSKSGRVVGQRGKQRVFITQKILTKQSTVKKVAAMARATLGRLKAAWATDWNVLNKNRRQPPQWIMRHADSRRGETKIELNIPGKGSITITNRASGISKTLGIVRRVMAQRIFAMKKDMANIHKGAYKRAGFANGQ